MILTIFNMIVGLQSLNVLVKAALYLVRVRNISQMQKFNYLNALYMVGLGLRWINEPNSTVFLGESFNVSYMPIVSARFYDNVAMSEYFPNMT